MSKKKQTQAVVVEAAAANPPATSGEPAARITQTSGDAATVKMANGEPAADAPAATKRNATGEPLSPAGLPADDPSASLPVGVAGSPVTRRDVPAEDQTETSHGGDAQLEDDGTLPPPRLGADEDDADTAIGELPIGVAGSLRTRADVPDGNPEKPSVGPAGKRTGPDRPYRVISLSLPLVDMHGYARREFFLGAEEADTLRDIAAGLASVGEKLDGATIDRPEKAMVWLLRRVRELANQPADASE